MSEPVGREPTGRGRPGRPYRVPLEHPATPEQVITGLDPDDQPGVLWGDWFDGGVVIMTRPMITRTAADPEEVLAQLAEPLGGDPAPDFAGVGGGWLVCLGYARGHTSLAGYDSLLRWTPAAGWVFESLGLPGREEASTHALAGWVEALTAASAPPGGGAGSAAVAHPGAGATLTPFGPRQLPDAAREHHLSTVEDVIGRIHRGDLYQVNLCTRLHAGLSGPAVEVFARAAARLQPAYGALVSAGVVDGRARTVASFSPELFLRVRGRTVTTQPIKGTAPRLAGETDSPALRASAKDAAENIMIVDLMRNDLSRVCRPGTVSVSDLLDVRPHPGVWHLVSTVQGQLDDGAGLADLLVATFPPGSVTGAPKGAAVRAIAELETETRGAYTGSIGFVSPYAGADFNVVIRTLEIEGDQVGLGVGGGLTADSVPVREWYECLHKAQPVVTAAGSRLRSGLDPEPVLAPGPVAAGVFESVLVRRGQTVRLDRHLARLDTSCRELYGTGLPADLAEQVRARVAGAGPGDRSAVRVTARPGPDGELLTGIDVRALGPRTTTCTLTRAERPGWSWRHKWVDRQSLVDAEGAVAPALPYFTAGPGSDRLSETSRGNLFLLGPDGLWRTPPLDESVLPGVTRREVLDRFTAHGVDFRVERCTVAGLQQARAAFWTSSLSGIVAVRAVDGHPLPAPPVEVLRLLAPELAEPPGS